MGVPDSAGVLPALVAHTRQLPYNDAEALESMLASHHDDMPPSSSNQYLGTSGRSSRKTAILRTSGRSPGPMASC